jgi:hypothetical protein
VLTATVYVMELTVADATSDSAGAVKSYATGCHVDPPLLDNHMTPWPKLVPTATHVVGDGHVADTNSVAAVAAVATLLTLIADHPPATAGTLVASAMTFVGSGRPTAIIRNNTAIRRRSVVRVVVDLLMPRRQHRRSICVHALSMAVGLLPSSLLWPP